MYELFKAALELVAKAVTSLAGRRKDDRLQVLGVELFALLAVAYEIVHRGEQIVVLLREAEPLAVAQATVSDPDSVHRWQSYLITGLREQLEALCEFASQTEKLRPLMMTVSPEEFSKVRLHLWAKMLSLLGFDPMITAAIQEGTKIELGVRSENWSEPVEALPEIPHTTVAAVRAYLDDQRPEERLASVRGSLAIVRDALEEHFSLADMLLGLQARAPQLRYGRVRVERSHDRHGQ
jgi:hypothetical protein